MNIIKVHFSKGYKQTSVKDFTQFINKGTSKMLNVVQNRFQEMKIYAVCQLQ